MAGQKEDIRTTEKGNVIVVNRGKKGTAVINISKSADFVNLPTGLPDGRYKDVVYGKEFRVVKGQLKGIMAPLRTYILVKG